MQTLPSNLLGEVLQYRSFRRIIAVSTTCRVMNELITVTLDTSHSEGESWWQRKVTKDCQQELEQTRQQSAAVFPLREFGQKIQPLTPAQRKQRMRMFGLSWREVYLVLSYRFMTVVRAVTAQTDVGFEVPQLHVTALTTYLLQADVQFTTPRWSAAQYPKMLTPSDVVYLHEHGWEEVIWHNIENNRILPTLYPEDKEYLLSEHILSSERMTPQLLVQAMHMLTNELVTPCPRVYIQSIVTNPNSRSVLAAILLIALHKAVYNDMIVEWIPADCSISKLTELLCAVLSVVFQYASDNPTAARKIVQRLLDRGASPNDTLRGTS